MNYLIILQRDIFFFKATFFLEKYCLKPLRITCIYDTFCRSFQEDLKEVNNTINTFLSKHSETITETCK